MKKATFCIMALSLALALFQTGFAGVTPEEAARLKTTLTPFGAERAGNADGTIPAWEGGYTTVPAGYKSGQSRPDPFADEKPYLTITGKNMDEYADKLAEGTKLLLKKYPEFRVDVYPTHRTAAAPQWVYEATSANATRAKNTDGGVSVEGAYNGIPFPIPKSGSEAIFNHLLAWQGVEFDLPFRIYMVTSSGKAILAVEAQNSSTYPYYYNDVPYEDFCGIYWKFRHLQTAPPFKAGECILWWDPVNMAKEGGRQAWQYLTGQRRVRRAPSIAYDTPDFVSSGQNYFDEVFIFNGAIDRYSWKMLGKKEMYIPYNCNKYYLAKDKDVIGDGKQYINPDYVRWELHRVWVVEATLAPGKRNVVAKRRFYLDEDTWFAVLYDGWDGKDQLWRYTQSMPLNIVELPGVIPVTFGIHNLETGSRTVTNQVNEMPVQYQVMERRPESFFTPDALAGSGVR